MLFGKVPYYITHKVATRKFIHILSTYICIILILKHIALLPCFIINYKSYLVFISLNIDLLKLAFTTINIVSKVFGYLSCF